MRPILKRLLPNQAKYIKSQGNLGEGISYEDSTILNHVKIEDEKKSYHSNSGSELIGNAILFYDLVNSSGLKDEPTVGSKIEYNERQYKVIDVYIRRDIRQKAHHYQLLLK